ncbi:MAG: pectinesterase family protein [Candidatus Aenigmatarchaeota archaeon]
MSQFFIFLLSAALLILLLPTFYDLHTSKVQSYYFLSNYELALLNSELYPLDSNLITVCSSGCNFTSIYSAINYANTTPGADMIYIKEGVYTENNIKLYSNITIVGDGIDKTIIRNKLSSSGIGQRYDIFTSNVPLENVRIENLTVDTLGVPDNMGSSAITFRGNGTNKNIVIRNVKSINAFGAGIAIPNFENLVIENCIINNTWTGITVVGGINASIKNNIIVNTRGDGIFPQVRRSSNLSVIKALIENNYLENIGDTGIDITSDCDFKPHEEIYVVGNKLKNASVRISCALNITLIKNFIKYGSISVDAGAGRPINIAIENNSIESSKRGIVLGGALNVTVRDNIIHFFASSDSSQTGISSGVWQSSILQNNIILNPQNYCIDFNNWQVGGSGNTLIENNTLINCGDVGIYDNNVSVGKVVIKGNKIIDFKNLSRHSILTEKESNVWIITNNWIYNKSIFAPSSIINDNDYSYPEQFYFPISLKSNKFIFSSILQDSKNKILRIYLEEIGFGLNEENTIEIFSPKKPSKIKINNLVVTYDDSLSLLHSWKYDSSNKTITLKFFS